MGKIIVKNIKGMGWKARLSLIAVFTLVFSVLFYQGYKQMKPAHAAVAAGTAWSNIHAAAPGTALAAGTNVNTTSTGTFTAGAGTNRLLLVAVYYEIATASTATFTTTFGGAAVTQIATSGGTSGREHVWLGYVKNATIPAAASTVISGINCATASTLTSVSIKVGTYTGVDQGTPIAGSTGVATATATVATTAVVNYLLGGMTVVADANGGTPMTTQTMTATPTITELTAASNTTNHATFIRQSAAHAAAGSYVAAGGISVTYVGTTSTRSGIAVASLRPATTTLGNGVAGTNANVAPGAANQKIDGFSFVTSSTGTTDSVTGLTVTTTGTAAIASVSIWNEAGTTQYFSTVSVPTGNTWAFTGGTPIPVTFTAANYKIYVTYKTRAGGAPAGNTATTANVTAITSSNVLAGTDTADTTLTLLNTHAASTWGTNTPGNNQVTLNWTYGTPTQSVVIIRYTANTDTTKPADGTTYSGGSAFGTGGTVRYVGPATTFIDSVGLVNGATYYYKIFEYDSFSYYYNATDVWTAGLTPVSPDAVPPTVDAGFAATTPVNTVNVPITSYGATDNGGGSGVAGYLITTSSTPPLAGAAGWVASPPATYTAAGQGSYTLYPWAKDGGANVSPVYGAPVAVVVDLTKPTVSAFTVNTPSTSKNIPIASFTTAIDALSGVNGYMITTSSAPPAAGAAGWTGTAPATYTVASDGSYTLYPWARDAAGNVSAVFGSPLTILVDSTAPAGLLSSSPADESTNQPLNVSLQSTTATDTSGPVQYWFQVISAELLYNENSGWQAGTSFTPTGLTQGYTYTWNVKAVDGLGNETAFTTPRTFTTQAPCVRNDPTVTLLTATNGIASTITADGGTALYNLKVINNDFGSCGSTTFNLSLADTDNLNANFNASTISAPSVTLNPGANSTLVVTVSSIGGHIGGANRTTATSAADVDHLAVSSSFVQTTLNVVGCTKYTPLLIIGPDSGYVNRGGLLAYTVTVKNTNTGTGCTPATFTFSRVDDNATDFNASTFSAPSISLNAGEQGSVTMTVSANAAAVKGNKNITSVGITAPLYTSPANKLATSTVGNPMLHNSDNTVSSKWSAIGGWGIPGGKYGEFDCNTCHADGYTTTPNIKRIRQSITAPDGSKGLLPGSGQPVGYTRMLGNDKNQNSLGWDSTATPRASSTKICEVCHTYDAARVSGVNAHPYSTGATLGNHFNTDGVKDCVTCHKHNKGFTASGMTCTACHGNSSVFNPTASNRYEAAPPVNASGVTGTLTGVSLVSNDPKVGAHQTHLRFTNGFSNYSTVDFRCEGCHGPLPASFAHINSNAAPSFQGMATRGGKSPSWVPASLTCNNTYCHNPAGAGSTLNAANTGTRSFVSWTSASYLDVASTKTQANCNKCHKVPEDAGFTSTYGHGGLATTNDCAGCHGHNGDTAGELGQRHLDGIKYGGGSCDSCHGYDVGTWAAKPERIPAVPEGRGAHEKHISYLKARYTVTLSPLTDQFGSANPSWTNVCGVCHATTSHTMAEAFGGTGRSISIQTAYKFGATNPTYNGLVGNSSAANNKSCSNVSCHYMTSPVWSTY